MTALPTSCYREVGPTGWETSSSYVTPCWSPGDIESMPVAGRQRGISVEDTLNSKAEYEEIRITLHLHSALPIINSEQTPLLRRAHFQLAEKGPRALLSHDSREPGWEAGDPGGSVSSSVYANVSPDHVPPSASLNQLP